MPEPALLGMGQVLEGWPVPPQGFQPAQGPRPFPAHPRSTAEATHMSNDKEQG